MLSGGKAWYRIILAADRVTKKKKKTHKFRRSSRDNDDTVTTKGIPTAFTQHMHHHHHRRRFIMGFERSTRALPPRSRLFWASFNSRASADGELWAPEKKKMSTAMTWKNVHLNYIYTKLNVIRLLYRPKEGDSRGQNVVKT